MHIGGKKNRRSGMTLVEILVATAIMLLVVAGAISMFTLIQRMWYTSMAQVRASMKVSRAMNYVVYGTANFGGIREAVVSTASLASSSNGWTFTYNTNRNISFSSATRRLVDQNGFLLCDRLRACTAVMTNGALLVTVVVVETNGPYVATNTASSYVDLRN